VSTAEAVGSLPWIPNEAAREKYEKSGDKTACGLASITGPVVDYGTRDRYEGDGQYDVITLDVDGVGRVAIHCQATVLERQMHAARPFKFGDVLTVNYLGEVTGKNDRAYHNYQVLTEREVGGEIQWADGFGEKQQVAAPPIRTGEVPAPSAPETDDDIPF
jgi:hypothetical protein